jgi:hypothetical protein
MDLKTSRRGIVSALCRGVSTKVVTGLAALMAAGAASAQPCDGQFQTGNGIPGISGNGNTIVSWDPDGAGPTPELLYAGGRFKLAHTTLVNSFASWEPLFNQQNPTGIWRSVAGGVTGAGGALGTINVLFPIGTDMLVGGQFTTAGGVAATNVVKFDGLTNTWIPYGAGVNGPVFAATIFNGQLFIGGRFQITPGIPSQDSVARWDGSRWRAVGAGFQIPDPADDPPSDPPLTLPGTVFSLAVHNNRLYAGGSFVFSGRTPAPELEPIDCQYFAVWNPQAQVWSPMLATELTAPFPYAPVVYTLRSYGGLLYLGGIWDNYGASIAVSNGVSELLGGVVAPVNGGVYKFFDWSKVYSLNQVGTELIVGGDFEYAGAASSRYAFNVVRWNGAQYLAVADGGSEGTVVSVAPHRGQLAIMGGLEVVNGQRVRGLSWYNGSIWTRTGLGQDGPITAMHKFNNQIVAGGGFGRMSNDTMALGVAFFNGTSWTQVGQGLSSGARGTLPLPPPAVQPNRPLQPPVINDLTTHNGDLIAVGEFSQSGSTTGFANIASWNGAVWSPVGQVDGPVYGAASYRGRLYIAGDLINYGNICEYDGFGGYNAVTFGTDGPGLCLTVHNDQLVAGGIFGFAGGVDTGVIAKWNYDTETWSRISNTQRTFTPPPQNPPIPPQCNAVAVIDGVLYAGGNWININGNANLRKLAKFDQASGLWVPVGPNLTGPNYDVWTINKVGNSIYVGGAGGANLMAFDGTAWRTVDGGTDGPVFGVEELNGRAWVGGNFLTASGEPSAYFTSYIADIPVSITTSPAGATVCEGGSVTLSVAATGTAPITYQWKRNGVDVAGATAPTLNLNPVNAGNAGNYTVVVRNSCSNATSGAAAVVVNPAAAITTQPQNRSLCSGQALSLSVTATGSPTYQWRLNGNNINGATASTYTVANPTAADAGNYTVVVSNNCNSVTSNAAVVTINQSVSITAQPQGQNICSSTALNLSVTATGSGTLTYQWRRNGNNIEGATSDTYSVANPTSANSGTYTVIVTNACGSLTSNAANVTVNQAAAITNHPQGAFGCTGGTVNLSVTATGSNLTYQWQRNGQNIEGATSSTYLVNVSVATAGDYRVLVSNSCGSVTSNVATVSVCGADFNCDQFVDFFDYLDFVTAFEDGLNGGDFNADGFIDFFDYIEFTDAYTTGC